MKKAAMGRSDKRAAMDRLRPSEKVEEEIDGVDVGEIRALDVRSTASAIG